MVENLRSCVFHPEKHKDCPIFRLAYILIEAESDPAERALMLRYGGVIRVKIDWDCNLDRRITRCRPKYSFARLDTRFSEETFSVGFNFRFASHWKQDQMYARSLTKAYGLRLIISVSGKAGKFDFITLTLNTGSLVGIFGLATFVCDLILLHMTKKATVYRDYIFQRVETPTASRNVTSTGKEQTNRLWTIYTNTGTAEQLSASAVRPLDTKMRSPEQQTRSMVSSAVIHPDELRRLQPSLGLTNTMHKKNTLGIQCWHLHCWGIYCTVDFLWYKHHDRYWYISKRFTSLQVSPIVSARSASSCNRGHIVAWFSMTSLSLLFIR